MQEGVTVWVCHVTNEEWRAITCQFWPSDNRIINAPEMFNQMRRDKSLCEESAYMLTAVDIIKKASYNICWHFQRAPRDIFYRVEQLDDEVLDNIKELLQPIADVPLTLKVLTKVL